MSTIHVRTAPGVSPAPADRLVESWIRLGISGTIACDFPREQGTHRDIPVVRIAEMHRGQAKPHYTDPEYIEKIAFWARCAARAQSTTGGHAHA